MFSKLASSCLLYIASEQSFFLIESLLILHSTERVVRSPLTNSITNSGRGSFQILGACPGPYLSPNELAHVHNDYMNGEWHKHLLRQNANQANHVLHGI
jgi:hypothetical protein